MLGQGAEIALGAPVMLKILIAVRRRGLPEIVGLLIIPRLERLQESCDGLFLAVIPEAKSTEARNEPEKNYA